MSFFTFHIFKKLAPLMLVASILAPWTAHAKQYSQFSGVIKLKYFNGDELFTIEKDRFEITLAEGACSLRIISGFGDSKRFECEGSDWQDHDYWGTNEDVYVHFYLPGHSLKAIATFMNAHGNSHNAGVRKFIKALDEHGEWDRTKYALYDDPNYLDIKWDENAFDIPGNPKHLSIAFELRDAKAL